MSRSKAEPDLTWADQPPLRNAVVVYDSRYGKTRRLAEAFARGVRSEGVVTDVLSVTEAKQRPIDDYDLLALGSPSSHLTSSAPMLQFLHSLKRMPRLRGHYGYGFDTRVRRHPGGGGRHIEAVLLDLGLRVLAAHRSAVVETPGRPATGARESRESGEYRLESGSEEIFEAIGVDLVRRIRGELKDQFA